MAEVSQRKGKRVKQTLTKDDENGILLPKKEEDPSKGKAQPPKEEYLLKNEDPERPFVSIFQVLRPWLPVLKLVILMMIAAISFISRTFSVIKFESVIHEFDPWFNFRSTRFMDQNGVYGFHNWFDSESWHPLGRVVGGTVYPGLMFTSCFIKWFIHWLSFPIDIRNICVFLAPLFSMF